MSGDLVPDPAAVFSVLSQEDTSGSILAQATTPRVDIPTNLAATAGDTVLVPVNIDDANQLESVDLRIQYDTALFDVDAGDVQLGSLTQQATFLANVDDSTGTIIVGMAFPSPLASGPGSLLLITFEIVTTAPSVSAAIDLQSVLLSEGQIVPEPQPQIGPDPTDGLVAITALNRSPVALDDSYVTNEDTPLVVTLAQGVLANDTDADSDPLAALLVAGPTHGGLVLNLDGSFTYTPNADFNGSDSFTYQANDGQTLGNLSNVATVSLSVTSVNDAPAGQPTTIVTAEDTPYVFGPGDFSLLDAGDTPGNSLLAITVTSLPLIGSLTAGGTNVSAGQRITVGEITSGSLVFAPAENANGAPYTTFAFQVQDDGGVLNGGVDIDPTPRLLTINVTAVNDAPIASGDSYRVDKSGTLVVPGPGVLVNDSDVEAGTLTAVLVADPTHGTLTFLPDGSFTYVHDGSQTRVDSFTYKASDGAADSTATVSIDIDGLFVSQFQPTSSGFIVHFNRAVDVSVLNLYDTQTAGLGPADVTLAGTALGNIRGSLVVQSADSMEFIATGGALLADTYTATVRSAANGFVNALVGILDGNQDGVSGDAFASVFAIADDPALVVRIPDFMFGAGQSIAVAGAGIPILLSDGNAVTTVEFVLTYNEALLTLTEVIGVVPGSQIQADFDTPGEVHVVVDFPAPAGSGPIEVVRLLGQVPNTAPYRDSHILRFENVSVNNGAAGAIADSGIHLAAYFGDATGTGTYSSLDAQRVLRVIAGTDNGFEAYSKIDPLVIADITGNGLLTSLDATRILQEVVGFDRPEIAPLPGIIVPAPVADPLVNIPTDVQANPGETVTVPVNIDNAALLQSVELKIGYDPGILELVPAGVRRGTLALNGTLTSNVDHSAGTVIVSLLLNDVLTGGTGSLVEMDFTVKATAPATTRIDLQYVSLNEGALILTLVPAPGPDPTDGFVTIDVAPAGNSLRRIDYDWNETVTEETQTFRHKRRQDFSKRPRQPAGWRARQGP